MHCIIVKDNDVSVHILIGSKVMMQNRNLGYLAKFQIFRISLSVVIL